MAAARTLRLRQLQTPTIERAYELAATGLYSSVFEIRVQLKGEGYVDYMSQLDGLWIKTQLRNLWLEANARTLPAPPGRASAPSSTTEP
jgi:hypothetical protein